FDGISMAPVFSDEEFGDGMWATDHTVLYPRPNFFFLHVSAHQSFFSHLPYLRTASAAASTGGSHGTDHIVDTYLGELADGDGDSALIHSSLLPMRSRHTHSSAPPMHLGLLLSYINGQCRAAQQLLRMQGNLRATLDSLDSHQRSRGVGGVAASSVTWVPFV